MEESAGVYARLLYTCLLGLVALVHAELSIELVLAASEDIAFFELAFLEFLIGFREQIYAVVQGGF